MLLMIMIDGSIAYYSSLPFITRLVIDDMKGV